MDSKEILRSTEHKMKKTVDATAREFTTIRTGRASGGLVEGIMVDYYGTQTPIKQLASISTPDAKLIVIQPWDKNSLPEVERAILKSDLGITPTSLELILPTYMDCYRRGGRYLAPRADDNQSRA